MLHNLPFTQNVNKPYKFEEIITNLEVYKPICAAWDS